SRESKSLPGRQILPDWKRNMPGTMLAAADLGGKVRQLVLVCARPNQQCTTFKCGSVRTLFLTISKTQSAGHARSATGRSVSVSPAFAACRLDPTVAVNRWLKITCA